MVEKTGQRQFFDLFIIFIFSLLVIFFRFPLVPKNLAFDEVEFARLALSLENQPYTPYSSLATGHSTLYFYLILFSIKIFGINNFALRLPSAISGVVAVFVFYFLVRKTKFKFPLIVTLLFLTSRWFFNFSRFAFEASFLLMLELISLNFLLKGIAEGLIYLAGAGFFSGLAFNSYTPGRIFFLLPLFVLLYQKKAKKLSGRAFSLGLLLFLLPFLITSAPLASYLLEHPDERVNQLFFWKNEELTLQEKITDTITNVKSLFLMFFWQGDLNGRHNYPGKPALNPFLAILFFFGVIIALRIVKKRRETDKKLFSLIFLVYLFLSLFPSLAVYSWENPNMLRTYTALPSVFFFIGLSLETILEKLKNPKEITLKAAYPTIILFLILSSFYEIRTYYKYQIIVFNDAFDVREPLEKIMTREKNNEDQ